MNDGGGGTFTEDDMKIFLNFFTFPCKLAVSQQQKDVECAKFMKPGHVLNGYDLGIIIVG